MNLLLQYNHCMTCTVAVQVGIIGLVEWEWLVTLATLEPDDVIYTDFVEAARELVPELQNEVWEPSFNDYLTCN